MPRYARVQGIPDRLVFPDETTDEAMDVGVRAEVARRNQAQVAAGQARLQAPDPLEEFMGPSQAPQAAPGGPPGGGRMRSPASGLMTALGLPEPPPEAGYAPTAPSAGEVGAEFIRESALPASLAAGGAPGLVGKTVGAGAAKALPGVAARLVGRGAALGTGAAMTGAPIAAEETLRGEDPMAAAKHGAIYGLLGEGLGAVGGRVLSSVTRPAIVAPAAAKAQRMLEPLGATLTPGQLSSSRTIRLLENVAEVGLGGTRVQKVREKAHDAASTLLRDYLDQLPERGGTILKNAYDDLAQRGIGVDVDMLPVIREAQNIAAQHAGRVPEIDKMVEWVTSLPRRAHPGAGNVGFDAAARLRGNLAEIGREAPGALNPQAAKGAAKRLTELVDNAMEASIPVGKTGSELYTAWRGTNALAKKAVFRDYAEDLVTKSLDKGKINGTQIAKRLERLTKADRKRLDPDSLKSFTDFANTMREVESRNPERTGAMFIQLMQAGAVAAVGTGIVTGNLDPDKAAILGVPYALSLILTNPRSARYLVQGLRSTGPDGGRALIQRAISVGTGQAMSEGQAEVGNYRAPWETAP